MFDKVLRVLNTSNGNTIFIQNVSYDTTSIFEIYARISEFLNIDIDDFMLCSMTDSIYLQSHSCKKLKDIGIQGSSSKNEELYIKFVRCIKRQKVSEDIVNVISS